MKDGGWEWKGKGKGSPERAISLFSSASFTLLSVPSLFFPYSSLVFDVIAVFLELFAARPTSAHSNGSLMANNEYDNCQACSLPRIEKEREREDHDGMSWKREREKEKANGALFIFRFRFLSRYCSLRVTSISRSRLDCWKVLACPSSGAFLELTLRSSAVYESFCIVNWDLIGRQRALPRSSILDPRSWAGSTIGFFKPEIKGRIWAHFGWRSVNTERLIFSTWAPIIQLNTITVREKEPNRDWALCINAQQVPKRHLLTRRKSGSLKLLPAVQFNSLFWPLI